MIKIKTENHNIQQKVEEINKLGCEFREILESGILDGSASQSLLRKLDRKSNQFNKLLLELFEEDVYPFNSINPPPII